MHMVATAENQLFVQVTSQLNECFLPEKKEIISLAHKYIAKKPTKQISDQFQYKIVRFLGSNDWNWEF